jgi:hypothetical protein
MGYGLIGPVQEGFPLKPGYGLLKMFTHNVEPGWRAVKIEGEVEDVWVSAMRSGEGRLTVFVLNRVKAEQTVTLGGLPRNRPFKTWTWNAAGKGELKPTETIATDGEGTAQVKIPNMAVEVLTLE